MTLRFQNALTKVEYEWEVEDDFESRILYHFHISLYEGMEDGSYNYFLYEDEVLLAQGLVQIGDYNNNPSTYVKEENGYKVYGE